MFDMLQFLLFVLLRLLFVNSLHFNGSTEGGLCKKVQFAVFRLLTERSGNQRCLRNILDNMSVCTKSFSLSRVPHQDCRSKVFSPPTVRASEHQKFR